MAPSVPVKTSHEKDGRRLQQLIFYVFCPHDHRGCITELTIMCNLLKYKHQIIKLVRSNKPILDLHKSKWSYAHLSTVFHQIQTILATNPFNDFLETFLKKFLEDTHVLFLGGGGGALVPLFWISGDVSSGFQSQSGFCLIRIVEANVMYIP